ncbi:MAG: hypothetical protein K5987_08450 [Lachnospiraceae bacterium]|nr:hypothetical protein [Lachnospiraceae bacterium]
MDNKTTQQFRKKIGGENRDLYGFAVCWCLALLLLPISELNTEGFIGEDFGALHIVMAGLLMIIGSNSYVSKYMNIYLGDEVEKKGVGLTGKEELTAILRYHGFDVTGYYKELALRFIPLQLFGLTALTAGVCTGIIGKDVMVVFIAAVVMIPEMVFLIRYLKTAYELQHEIALYYKFIEGLWNGIYSLIRLFTVGIVMIMLDIVLMALAPSAVLMKGIADTEAVCFYVGGGWLIMALIISVLLMGVYLTDIDRDMMAFSFIKMRKLILAGSIAVFILTVAAYSFISINSNICVRENSFTIKEGGSIREYAVEDIADYRVYGKDTLKLEIIFKDGTKTQLFRDGAESTTAWSDKYYSDFNYAAELTGKLSVLGVQGSIDDKDKLQAYVNGLDQPCRDGYDQILRNMGADEER